MRPRYAAAALVSVLALVPAVPATAQNRTGPAAPRARAGGVAESVAGLTASEPAARAAAATRLGGLYPDAAAASPALVEVAASDADPGVRDAARAALCRLAAEGLGDIATYLEGLRKQAPARAGWLDACSRVDELGPALTPRDLAALVQSFPGVAPRPADVARMRAVPVLCASLRLHDDEASAAQARAVCRSAARSDDTTLRRNALAALAVLGRADLIRRRAEGDPSAIPAVDDARVVTRLLSVLTAKSGDAADLQQTLESHVIWLLGWSYGHAGPQFLELLAARDADAAAAAVVARVDRAALRPDAPGAERYVRDLGQAGSPRAGECLTALSVRRPAAVSLLPEIRKLLASADPRVRLFAALAVLQFAPGDPDAGALLMQEFRRLLDERPDGEGRGERERALATAAEWVRRMPEPPPGLSDEFWVMMPRNGDRAGEEACARAMGPSLARNTLLQRYLRKHVFPDEGAPDRPAPGARAAAELADALGLAGAASAPMLEEWTSALADEPQADPAQQVLQLGPAWESSRPERLLPLLAANGARAAAAIPTVEALLESDDPLLRYVAARALPRLRAE